MGKNLLLLFSSIFLTLSLCEVVLRYNGYAGSFDPDGRFLNIHQDHDLDWVPEKMKPRLEWYKNLPSDFKLVESVQINHDLIKMKKDSNIKRVLFIGDSGTFGSGVPFNKNYAYLIKEKLDKSKYEVINGGVPGFSPYDTLKLLYQKYRYLDPDIVIYGFFAANDVQETGGNYYSQKWFEEFQKRKKFELLEGLALYNFIFIKTTQILASKKSQKNEDDFDYKYIERKWHDQDVKAHTLLGDFSNHVIPEPAVSKTSWLLFKEQMRLLKKYSQETNAKVVTLVIPSPSIIFNQVQIYNNTENDTKKIKDKGFPLEKYKFDQFLPNKNLAKICDDLDFLCIDPSEDIIESIDGRKFFLQGDNHPSIEGHRFLSNFLWEKRDMLFP